MSADSVLELIAKNVLSTIQGVTTGNGCSYTLVAARESKRNDGLVQHLHAIVCQDDPSNIPDLEAQNIVAWSQPFAVIVCVQPADEAESVDAISNLIEADI